jgi:hypothetical protein
MGLFTKAVATLARKVGLADQRLFQMFSAGETDAGEVISVQGALQLDVVWACVRRIAETVATLPLHVYALDAAGHPQRADDHPLYKVLHDRPNADMTSVEFFEALVGCYLLWGNAFASITRGTGGRIIALDPMRPDRVSIVPQSDGSLQYRYAYLSQTQTFAEDDVLHIKGFSLDGLMGLSPVAQARQNLGTARAAERASGSFFKNGMRPSGYLKAPDYLTKDQRDQAKILLAKFKGATNTGRHAAARGRLGVDDAGDPARRGANAADAHLPCGADLPLVRRAAGAGRPFRPDDLGIRHRADHARLADARPAIASETHRAGDLAGCSRRPSVGALRRIQRRRAAAGRQRGTRPADGEPGAERPAHAQRACARSTTFPPIAGGDALTVQSNLLPIDKLGEISTMPREKPVDPGAALAASTTGANIPGK